MRLSDSISFGFSRPVPLFLQTEAAECSLACIGMIAGYHGFRTDLASLRGRFSVSLKGATLAHCIDIASEMKLATRAVKVDLDQLNQLALPCMLHWNFNHYVLLKSVSSKFITVHDPAIGVRKISIEDASKAFTGIALEAWPQTDFAPVEMIQTIRLHRMLGRTVGIARSFGQIFLLALVLEIFSLINPFFLQWVIDDVIVSASHELLTTLALGFGLLILLQEAVGAIRQWAILYLSTTLYIQWNANVFTHLLRLPVQYFEKRHLGDIVSRFGSIEHIQRTITTSFIEAMLDGLMVIVTLIMMLIYDRDLTFVALTAMGLYVVCRWIWFMPLRNATEEQIIHAATQQSHFLESIRGIKAIKLFQRQNERHSRWLTFLVEQVNANLRTEKLQLVNGLINRILFGIENIVIVWLGAKLVLNGNFSVGVLMAFIAYKMQFSNRVTSLIDKFFEVKMLRLQGERLADIVFTKPEVLSHGEDIFKDSESLPIIEAINLRFRYADHDPYILDGVNFTIYPGESVALSGPSGCGKSTLLNILLGILPPTGGDVLIGKASIRRVGINALRRTIGTVLQDDVLFAGSISENISFFDPLPDQAWISECAAMAAIAEEINAMPMGYNTLVGDMGTVLSGGEKQRILLARALYKRPTILVLDEATSHLDIGKESQVNAAVRSLNITRIIVAHRPETIASADRVIVLVGGRVIQDEKILRPADATPSIAA